MEEPNASPTSAKLQEVPQQQQQQQHNENPPWHSVALMVAFVAIFLQTTPDLEPIPRDTFTRVLFPQYHSLSALVAIRLLFTAIIFADVFRAFALVVYLDHKTEYYPGSHLQAGANIDYRRISQWILWCC